MTPEQIVRLSLDAAAKACEEYMRDSGFYSAAALTHIRNLDPADILRESAGVTLTDLRSFVEGLREQAAPQEPHNLTQSEQKMLNKALFASAKVLHKPQAAPPASWDQKALEVAETIYRLGNFNPKSRNTDCQIQSAVLEAMQWAAKEAQDECRLLSAQVDSLDGQCAQLEARVEQYEAQATAKAEPDWQQKYYAMRREVRRVNKSVDLHSKVCRLFAANAAVRHYQDRAAPPAAQTEPVLPEGCIWVSDLVAEMESTPEGAALMQQARERLAVAHAAPPAAQIPAAAKGERVYCVPDDDGRWTHSSTPIPMADNDVLYYAPPAAQIPEGWEGWINPKERLPREGEVVLAIVDGARRLAYCRYSCHESGSDWYEWQGVRLEFPSHFQYLPSLPAAPSPSAPTEES